MAGDGVELVVTANTEKMWVSFCDVVERPDLVADPRFATPKDRLANKETLWAKLEPIFLDHPAAEWVDRLERNDVPCAVIKSVPEALADARLCGRSMVVEFDGPGGERVPLVGDPIKFVGAPSPTASYPPRLGVDCGEILGEWLGMPHAEIDALLERRVLFTR